MGRRPLSLHSRLLIAMLVTLAALIGATAAALDAAFRESARDAVRDRLQGHVYTLLAAANVEDTGVLLMPDSIPEPAFSRPGSGLYAQVNGNDFRWRSASQLGALEDLPVAPLAPGESNFSGPIAVQDEALFLLRLGIAWELADGGERRFTFAAAESTDAYDIQIRRFRRELWGWLGLAALVLMAVQGSILRWGLRPLRAIAGELRRVERGEAEEISGRYPRELVGLAENLNAFIRSERRHLERFRNSLADLAHSLKTPLAVIRSALDGEPGTDERETIAEQVRRMDDIVAYQLKRGRTSGHRTLARPVPVLECVQPLVRSLGKIYANREGADRDIHCEIVVADTVSFYGDRGDLTELLGNLLDNGFKWCASRVRLGARQTGESGERRPGLELTVEDDGEGIAEDRVADVLRRGVRADERVTGHGIGLAMAGEIVRAYDGDLAIERSVLGGALVRVTFPGPSTAH